MEFVPFSSHVVILFQFIFELANYQQLRAALLRLCLSLAPSLWFELVTLFYSKACRFLFCPNYNRARMQMSPIINTSRERV